MLRVVYVLVSRRSERGSSEKLLPSLSPRRDTLDKCKERIVETSRIVDPRSKPVRVTLPFAPVLLQHTRAHTFAGETVPLSREMLLIS